MGRAFEARKASKFARWDKMAKAFTKAGRQITMAVKAGGADAEANTSLKRAIQNARAANMPKDRIEAAIKKASDKDTSGFEEIVYEGMGPHGIAVVVETATDNSVRTVANIRSYFRKKNGSLGTSGMHDFLFQRMGVFIIESHEISDIEAIELDLIDFGLDSYEAEAIEGKDIYRLLVPFVDFGLMQEGLDKLNIKILRSELERIPTTTKELDDQQIDEFLGLVDLLEQDDDITNVFHNLS